MAVRITYLVAAQTADYYSLDFEYIEPTGSYYSGRSLFLIASNGSSLEYVFDRNLDLNQPSYLVGVAQYAPDGTKLVAADGFSVLVGPSTLDSIDGQLSSLDEYLVYSNANDVIDFDVANDAISDYQETLEETSRPGRTLYVDAGGGTDTFYDDYWGSGNILITKASSGAFLFTFKPTGATTELRNFEYIDVSDLPRMTLEEYYQRAASAGPNTVQGTSGDDVFTDTDGNDTYYGYEGNDTVVFSGHSSTYNAYRYADITGVQHSDGEIDRLYDVESLAFSNGTISPVENFDPLAYIASYGDLIEAYGPDDISGFNHFLQWGLSAGRSISFDADQYLANYADLQEAYGSDTEAATAHYIKWGYSAGRTDEPVKVPTDNSSGSDSKSGDTGNNDTFTGGKRGGSDFNGGVGHDTVAYSLLYSDVAVNAVKTVSSKDGSGYVSHWEVDFDSTDSKGNSTTATDTLRSIERVEFTDKTLALDVGLGQNAGQALALLYAWFGSLPEEELLGEWVTAIDDIDPANYTNTDMQQLAQSIIDTYAPGISNEMLVRTLYENVVGTPAPSSAISSFVGQIENNTYTQASIYVMAASTDLNTEQYYEDIQYTGVTYIEPDSKSG